MEIESMILPKRNEIDLKAIWSKYFPYWPVFLLLTALAIAGAWIYLQKRTAYYESTATLLIKDERKGIEDSKMTESLDLLTSKKTIENEIEVIQSRTLIKQVVQKLGLYVSIFKKDKWKNISAYATSPVKIEVQNPDHLIEVNNVAFAFNSSKGVVTIAGKNYVLGQWAPTPWGTLRFTAANNGISVIGPFYFSLIHPKRITQQLMKSLEVSVSNKLSSVISLKLKDEVPERSEDILEALVDDYSKASINDKNALAENTLSFLDERLQYVSSGLDSIEKQLQLYKAKKGAIDISSQGKLFLENVSGNDQKLSDVNMKLAILKQIESYVSSNDNRGGLVPSTLGVDDPLLTSLLDKLYDAELDYEKIKRTTGENNPELISVVDKIKKIKPSVLENIRSQLLSLEANKRNLYATNSTYSSLIQALPQQERDLVEISREQSIKTGIYSFLLQKREETALAHSSTVSDTRIVDKAESSLDPIGGGSKLFYGVAVIAALALGILFISLRDFFTNTIMFRNEIETITSFPVIGEIAFGKSKTPLVIDYGSTGLIAEEFRMLRTSLHSLGLESTGKNLLVTSTIPGEGKSFVAINLAISLALSGKKVILVEFDLNNPTLATKMGIPDEGVTGVADYLSGNIEAGEGIIPVENHPNLFLMTAGNLPHNPSELILSEKTPELLETLKQQFNYVVVDSAPVGVLSDGYVLSRYCDATLYIVRHRHTPKKMLERLEQNNKINQLKNLVIVFNGVRFRGFSRNSYGYGYTYNQKRSTKERMLAR